MVWRVPNPDLGVCETRGVYVLQVTCAERTFRRGLGMGSRGPLKMAIAIVVVRSSCLALMAHLVWPHTPLFHV